MAIVETYNGLELPESYYSEPMNVTPGRGNELQGTTTIESVTSTPEGVSEDLWRYRLDKLEELAVCYESPSAHNSSEIVVLEAKLALADAQIMLESIAANIKSGHDGEQVWAAMKIDELMDLRGHLSDDQIIILSEEAGMLREAIAQANNITDLSDKDKGIGKILRDMEFAIDDMRAESGRPQRNRQLGERAADLTLAA